jgi:hypothetical protein
MEPTFGLSNKIIFVLLKLRFRSRLPIRLKLIIVLRILNAMMVWPNTKMENRLAMEERFSLVSTNLITM